MRQEIRAVGNTQDQQRTHVISQFNPLYDFNRSKFDAKALMMNPSYRCEREIRRKWDEEEKERKQENQFDIDKWERLINFQKQLDRERIRKGYQLSSWQYEKQSERRELYEKEITFQLERRMDKELREMWEAPFSQLLEEPSVQKEFNISIGQFTLLNKLGQGSYGEVFKAYHKLSHTLVALKCIQKEKIKKTFNGINFLLNEMKMHISVSHKNIASLYGFFDCEHYIYLVLQYLTEQSLQERLNQRIIFQQSEAKIILKQIVSALEYMHHKCIIHRDLKPTNFIFSYGVVKIIDFGLANTCKKSLRSSRCGSRGYQAPQLLEGREYGCSVDLYSLGVISYQLMTGQMPYPDEISKITDRISYPLHLSSDARDFIECLMIKNPVTRYTAEEARKHRFLRGVREL